MGSEDNDRERVRDIIKRLLNRAVNAEIIKEKPNLYYDAAHQIEQLYDENETLRRDVKTAVMGDSAELRDVKREIAKFYAQAEMNARLLTENASLRAENKMLRERLDEIWQGLQTVCGDVRAAIRESGDE
jgi:hypothetical protein